ncbi:MAG: ankyrin repeat domain-containing protein, partial [Gammaproteobacteria bacterium]
FEQSLWKACIASAVVWNFNQNKIQEQIRKSKQLIEKCLSALRVLYENSKQPVLSFLHFCIRKISNVLIIRYLLSQSNIDIDEELDSVTPLLLVLDRGNIEYFAEDEQIANCLIEHNADIELRNNAGENALHLAAKRGFADFIVKAQQKNFILFDRAIEAENNTGQLPLYSAVNSGQLTIAEFIWKQKKEIYYGNKAQPLVEFIAFCSTNIDGKDNFIFSLLTDDNYISYEKNKTTLERPLLECVLAAYIFSGFTIYSKPQLIITQLQTLGIDFYYIFRNENFLDKIIQSYYIPRQIIELKRSFPAKAVENYFYVLSFFINLGLKANLLPGYGTLLHRAATDNDLELIKYLYANHLEEFRDWNQLNNEGEYPLHRSCRNENDSVETVEYLLNCSLPAIATAIDNFGNTVLHICAQRCNKKSLEKLLSIEHIQEMINYKNKQGRTALHELIYSSNKLQNRAEADFVKCAELLVQCGGSVLEKDGQDQTPLMIAKTYKKIRLIRCLKSVEEKERAILASSVSQNKDSKTVIEVEQKEALIKEALINVRSRIEQLELAKKAAIFMPATPQFGIEHRAIGTHEMVIGASLSESNNKALFEKVIDNIFSNADPVIKVIQEQLSFLRDELCQPAISIETELMLYNRTEKQMQDLITYLENKQKQGAVVTASSSFFNQGSMFGAQSSQLILNTDIDNFLMRK